MWRFLFSVCIGWFGTVIPVLMSGIVRQLSWGLRLLLPNWIVHGSFAVALLLWIALMLSLPMRVWRSPRSRVTMAMTINVWQDHDRFRSSRDR